MDNTAYYYGFRQMHPTPPAQWIVQGPFVEWDDSMRDRERCKQRYDGQVTIPFVAASEEEALQRVPLF